MNRQDKVLLGVFIGAILVIVGFWFLFLRGPAEAAVPAEPAVVVEESVTDYLEQEARLLRLEASIAGLTESLEAQQAHEVAEPVEAEVEEIVEVAAEVVGNPSPDVLVNFRHELPAYMDFRGAIRTPADTATFLWRFDERYFTVTLLRVVADDELESVLYNGEDITSLLEMVEVEAGAVGISPELAEMLALRGVNVGLGEDLIQNSYSIHLGSIEPGDEVRLVFRDNPEEQVNVGGMVVFSADTDPYTLELDGSPVEFPTFIPGQ